MSHAKNKVDWCLRKALQESKAGVHKGLLKIAPNRKEADLHIAKAEHYLLATQHLQKSGFSDISASTAFYSMYHCLLAICIKQGYESHNQECTFSLIESLVEDGKIDFDSDVLCKIANAKQDNPGIASRAIRELMQYGTSLSLEDNLCKELVQLVKQTLFASKKVLAGKD
ncbi:MAG: HEPN domain-containing protein [Candidatus Woesearchaeota archaeon]